MVGERAWVARSVLQVNASRARLCAAREPHNITFATWIVASYQTALQPIVTYIQSPLSISGSQEPHVHQYHNPIRQRPNTRKYPRLPSTYTEAFSWSKAKGPRIWTEEQIYRPCSGTLPQQSRLPPTASTRRRAPYTNHAKHKTQDTSSLEHALKVPVITQMHPPPRTI
jgi:hypothetical protein